MAVPARTTITLGPALRTLLTSGSVRGANFSERLQRLADRYAAMVAELTPTRWSSADWLTIMSVLDDLDIGRATDALVVSLRLKQRHGEPVAGADPSSVAYRYGNLGLAEQLAVLDTAERARSDAVNDIAAMTSWLDDQSIRHT